MEAEEANPSNTNNEDLITSFCEITSSTREEALFFLESHNFHLDSAVSTFLDNDNDNNNNNNNTNNNNENINVNPAAVAQPIIPSDSPSPSPSPSKSPDYSPSRSRSRSPSPTPSRPPYQLRSTRRGPTPNNDDRTRGNVRTLADLNRPAREDHGSDSDEPQEYYTGGEKRYLLYSFSIPRVSMFGCRENLIMKLANNNNRIVNFCQIEDNFFLSKLQNWKPLQCNVGVKLRVYYNSICDCKESFN